MLAIVGVAMKDVIGMSAGILEELAKVGVSVKLVIQGIKEISLIVGVREEDFEKTIKALYAFAEKCNKDE